MKPILFSTAMVQALLNGTKMQTRRVCKEKALQFINSPQVDIDSTNKSGYLNGLCTYGQVGDILWVRETFQIECGAEDDPIKYNYRADGETLLPWKPSIFMPKEACRIFLKITNIRIERLHEISNEDVENEGVDLSCTPGAHFIMWHRL